ncbi:MAG: carboxypeptidase regulatory-like domain-containing protein [Acidobacteria bacterium]|nr:carboxypeptidase regulatory-like domain-containing protein [Acidobacteriota bacterium]
MRITFSRFLAVLALMSVTSILAFAQADVTSATVRGTVTDQQGAAVAGATVTARNIAQGTTRSDTTNADGEFQILALRPGLYEISVQAQGFARFLIQDAQLTVGQVATYAVKLDIAKVTNEVTVTSSAPLIEVERTQQSNTIESRQIESLPNIGRDFTSYVFTLPGVASSNAPRVQGGGRYTFGSSGFSIGGSNGRNNLITVDGGENEYGSGQLRFGISPEAVQEFQVNRSSFNAEFGFTAGTAVNVVTKSGGNDFHGSAYFFYRSDKTMARERFIPSFVPNSARIFQQQAYPGFTLGGPIVKNKLFFFTNYERQKLDLPRFRSYTNNAQTCREDVAALCAPQKAILAQLAGSGNANLVRIGNELRSKLITSAQTNNALYGLLRSNEGILNSPYRLNNWISRVDYNISEKDTLTGRFSLAHNFNEQSGTDPLQSQSSSTNLFVRDYTTLLTWTHNFNSHVVNQARVQFSPKNSALTASPVPDSTALVFQGVGNFNRNIFAPFDTKQDRYQFEDLVTLLSGNHTFKFGGSYRPVSYNVRNELWFGGEWTFSPGVYPLVLAVPAADQAAFVGAVGTAATGTTLNALQAFNAGLPFLFRQSVNNPVWQDKVHFAGLFAQDSWKVNSRFSLDYGFRVDFDIEPEPIPDNTYFSPRLGFAWDLTGDKKTVLRGGGGLFYSPIYYQIAYLTNLLNDSGKYINQTFRTPAFPAALTPAAVWARGVAGGRLPFKAANEADLGAPVTAKAPGRVVIELGPDYRANYSIQGSLGLQRQITNSLSLDLAYNVYRGLHIQMPVPQNFRESANPAARCAAINANPLLQPLMCRNPALGGPVLEPIDPTITQLTYYSSRGSSIYHGLTASLQKRFSDNFSFQANYTWSKTIDDVADFNTAFYAPYPTRLFLERALSSFDIRHNFVFSGTFRSPWKNYALRDFTLSPIISLRSGIPFTLTTGTDVNSDTRVVNDRIFYIGRNTGLGPNFKSVDFRLNRAFRFKSDSAARLEFLVEVVNLFNRTNFASVRDIIPATLNAQNQLTEPDYNAGTVRLKGRRDRNWEAGQPLAFQAAFDPRRFQFGLKLVF